MAEVECLPGQKHVNLWSTGVGTVNFPHNKYRFPLVAVYKVDPEVGEIFTPPLRPKTGHPTNPNTFGK